VLDLTPAEEHPASEFDAGQKAASDPVRHAPLGHAEHQGEFTKAEQGGRPGPQRRRIDRTPLRREGIGGCGWLRIGGAEIRLASPQGGVTGDGDGHCDDNERDAKTVGMGSGDGLTRKGDVPTSAQSRPTLSKHSASKGEPLAYANAVFRLARVPRSPFDGVSNVKP
jgi:hypothetical protein